MQRTRRSLQSWGESSDGRCGLASISATNAFASALASAPSSLVEQGNDILEALDFLAAVELSDRILAGA
jgi:hypothetical protein